MATIRLVNLQTNRASQGYVHSEDEGHSHEEGLSQRLIAWEDNKLTECQTLKLFQELVDSGAAWQSTGAVRSTACLLIHDGRIRPQFT